MGASWTQTTKLVASDGAPNGGFGFSLALDGTRLVVGAPASEAAYVFEFGAGVWTEAARIQASDGKPFDGFGVSVDLDADRIVVGAYTAQGVVSWSGAAYVFDLGGTSWTESAKLYSASGSLGYRFGAALVVEGTRILVGAYNTVVGGVGSGAVHVFELGPGGWSDTALLSPSDGQFADTFGASIGLEGDTALIGAPGVRYVGLNPGAAYVFDGSGASWTETAKLVGAAAQPWEEFGVSVALDGDVALAGSYAVYGLGSGKSYINAFSLSGTICYDLFGTPPSLSLAYGGTQQLQLAAGSAHAGKAYVLAGSASGSSPGTWFGPWRVPLNVDAYTAMTLNLALVAPPFGMNVGVLDGSGGAPALVTVPAGSDPSLAGAVLTHAYAVLDTSAGLALDHVSTAATLTLDP